MEALATVLGIGQMIFFALVFGPITSGLLALGFLGTMTLVALGFAR
jgi:hypothetical protein